MAEDWEPPPPSLGAASGLDKPEESPDDEYPLAMLWLPNPEYPKGWETRRVKRQAGGKPPRRLGFGR